MLLISGKDNVKWSVPAFRKETRQSIEADKDCYEAHAGAWTKLLRECRRQNLAKGCDLPTYDEMREWAAGNFQSGRVTAYPCIGLRSSYRKLLQTPGAYQDAEELGLFLTGVDKQGKGKPNAVFWSPTNTIRIMSQGGETVRAPGIPEDIAAWAGFVGPIIKSTLVTPANELPKPANRGEEKVLRYCREQGLQPVFTQTDNGTALRFAKTPRSGLLARLAGKTAEPTTFVSGGAVMDGVSWKSVANGLLSCVSLDGGATINAPDFLGLVEPETAAPVTQVKEPPPPSVDF
jgi:hypothetical protein